MGRPIVVFAEPLDWRRGDGNRPADTAQDVVRIATTVLVDRGGVARITRSDHISQKMGGRPSCNP
jgi:hypothetical protein